MSLHQPSRGPDLFLAIVLFCAALFVLVRSNDMGFMRDEAFYFGHAETYQNWFVRIEKGGEDREKALRRAEILDTWQHNNEHPPLNKILFGYSWRTLGRKLRPVDRLREAKGDKLLDIAELGPAHGFDVNAQVAILAPQVVGQPASPSGRQLLMGTVTERGERSATVRLAADADLAKLKAVCLPPGPGDAEDGSRHRRTGCEAVERRLLYVLSESAAMRFPGAVFGAFLVALIYLAGRMVFCGPMTAGGPGQLRRPFALLAAVGYLCLPQPFWHAHLCTFDTTIVALLFATTVVWHRALVARGWIWLAAGLWGFALLAKHNALFLPIPLILHWLLNAALERRIVLYWPTAPRRLLSGVAVSVAAAVGLALVHPLLGVAALLIGLAATGVVLELPAVPGVFFAMLAVGPLLLVAGWPLLWVDTFDNLLRWIEFHLHHEHYMQVWFGKVLAYPPFPPQFAWGMTALTWPLTLLVPVALGLVALYLPQGLKIPPPVLQVERFDAWLFADRADAQGGTPEQRSWQRLLLLSALWPIALISMPGTPIFGGTKHWMPAYPFLLLIGAYGVQAVWRTVMWRQHDVLGQANGRARLVAWVMAVLLIVPAALDTRATYKHGAAYYNELIGGVPGAADRGMQRQFWGGSTREGLEEVNRVAPANALVYMHKSAWGAFEMYQREGWLRRDLRYGGSAEGSAVAFYHHQKDHDDYQTDLMRDYRHFAPDWQYALDGVPILSVHRRPVASRAAAPLR